MTEQKEKPIIVKKYANRRLYDTSTSSYVTLEDLCQHVKHGSDFQVLDAKTGEDLTRSVLTQIIFEQESKGYNLLPINFLRNIIRFYDDNLSSVLPSYLDTAMDNFSRNQDKMRDYVDTFGGITALRQLEEVGKQNMELFEQTMEMFSSFNPLSNTYKKKDNG